MMYYFSRDTETASIDSTTSRNIIHTLKNLFVSWELPQELVGRTTGPVLKKKLSPSPVSRDLLSKRDAAAKEAHRFFYDDRHSVQPLPELHPGQNVEGPRGEETCWKRPAKALVRQRS